MRTILFLIGLFIINVGSLVGQQKELENIDALIRDYYTWEVIDIETCREIRFDWKPDYSYIDDTDLENIDVVNQESCVDKSEILLLFKERNAIKVKMLINRSLNLKPYPSKSNILNVIDPIDLVCIG